MSDSEYCKMLEMPINTCDVIIKPNKHKRKAVVKEVIEKVNEETLSNEVLVKKPKFKFLKNIFYNNKEKKNKEKKPKIRRVKREKQVESESAIKNKKFDIVAVQITAIFVLVVGIILTNIFWEDSGMNNLIRSVFSSEESLNSQEYTSFSASVPSKSHTVSINDGVMTFASGSCYSPCDGRVESLSQDGDTFTMTIRHSDSFTTVFTGLEFCYVENGDNVYANIPLGYSSSPIKVSMYDDNYLLTNYSITGNNIIWLN